MFDGFNRVGMLEVLWTLQEWPHFKALQSELQRLRKEERQKMNEEILQVQEAWARSKRLSIGVKWRKLDCSETEIITIPSALVTSVKSYKSDKWMMNYVCTGIRSSIRAPVWDYKPHDGPLQLATMEVSVFVFGDGQNGAVLKRCHSLRRNTVCSSSRFRDYTLSHFSTKLLASRIQICDWGWWKWHSTDV